MKIRKNTAWLPIAVLALSAASYGLRKALYMTAVDAKNLLIAGHPLEIALWAVVLCGAGLIVAAVRKLDGSNVYEENFGPGIPGGIAYFLMAYVVGKLVLLNDFAGTDRIAGMLRVLGAVTAPGLVWGGVSRIRGKKPFFLIHGALSVFLLLYLISWYQLWSGNPQLQDYVFSLLGAMALMFFGFYNAAREAGCGNYPMQLAMGLAAVYFCLGELARSSSPALYLGGLLWVLTEIYAVTKPETT